MTTTQENNKLIAEFMGVKPRLISPDVYGFSDGPFFSCIHDTPEKVIESISKYAKYHSDWNWLMQAIEKIEKELKEEFRVVILEDECTIHQKTENCNLQIEFICVAEAYETSKIEAVYNACVEFIKWYNEQNQIL